MEALGELDAFPLHPADQLCQLLLKRSLDDNIHVVSLPVNPRALSAKLERPRNGWTLLLQLWGHEGCGGLEGRSKQREGLSNPWPSSL